MPRKLDPKSIFAPRSCKSSLRKTVKTLRPDKPFSPRLRYTFSQPIMRRHVLIFGIAGGLLIATLQYTEYRFVVIEHSVDSTPRSSPFSLRPSASGSASASPANRRRSW